MRPILRGAVPQINGVDKVVTDYKDWREDLLEVLGNYCSYCNMVLNDSPQVEHVKPKIPQPGQVPGALLKWDNMLLACGPCNRAKGNKPVNFHYFPDQNNTHLIFEYIVILHPKRNKQYACIPVPANNQSVNYLKTKNTIDLCKLNALTVNPRATDLRWKYRYETWYSANEIWRKQWDDWGQNKKDGFIPLLIDTAKAKGFFFYMVQCF
ncbi:MAG: HNH endonuclease [Sporocytophaga sp.]|nr:HNH endonuclease [Sporocytophaga sp.]